MAKTPDDVAPDIATQIMQRMVRMPPKHHEDMKVGRPMAKKQRSRAKVQKTSDERD
jgi:hypothetical protein